MLTRFINSKTLSRTRDGKPKATIYLNPALRKSLRCHLKELDDSSAVVFRTRNGKRIQPRQVQLRFGKWLKEEFKRNPIRILGTVLLSGALRTMKHRMDPEMYGGAPLLGVNGICIITHGASSAKAIYHAIRVAKESVVGHMNEMIISEIKRVEAAA